MDTITVWVVEEGLNVRSRDVLGKSIPAVLRERSQNLYRIPAYSDELRYLTKGLTYSCVVHGVQGYNDISGQDST